MTRANQLARIASVLVLFGGVGNAAPPDSDNDGILDWADNCLAIANASQCDSDEDGAGNHCDGDLNQSGGTTNFGDLAAFGDAFGSISPEPVFAAADFDCSGGVVSFPDLFLFKDLFGTLPGPSGRGFAIYNEDAGPVFTEKCQPCHTGFGFGDHNIGTTYADALLPADDFGECAGLNVGQCTIVLIQNGEMPDGAGCTGNPTQDAGNASCLTQDEQDTIQSWIDAGLPE